MTQRKTNNPRFSTAYRHSSLKERFKMSYRKKKDGCWIWIGHTSGHPDIRFRYGTIVSNRKRILAHRLSWELYTNEKIPTGKFICHKCDIPLCVNPSHLFLGDPVSNMVDREMKHRGPQGERNWCAKLKEKDISKIKKLWKSGKKQVEIAALFGVSQGAISSVVNDKTWKHISKESE